MNDTEYYIGIDPGADGAITVLNSYGYVVDICFFKKSTDYEVADFLQNYQLLSFAYLENVHGMPKQGIASTFKFGKSFGLIIGILTALGLPYELVSPTTWQTAMKCKSGGDKRITRAAAQRLFAREDIKITHAIADSMLIAEYCRRERVKITKDKKEGSDAQ